MLWVARRGRAADHRFLRCWLIPVTDVWVGQCPTPAALEPCWTFHERGGRSVLAPTFFHWAMVEQKTVLGLVFHGCSLQEGPGVGVEPRQRWAAPVGGMSMLQIKAPPIFLMELDGTWSSRNGGNLVHCVSASQEKPRAWIWGECGCVVNQMPQGWELGSAMH